MSLSATDISLACRCWNQHRTELREPTRASSSCETMVYATGCYRDVIVTDASDGVLRFAERIVVLDSRQIDTLLALPL